MSAPQQPVQQPQPPVQPQQPVQPAQQQQASTSNGMGAIEDVLEGLDLDNL